MIGTGATAVQLVPEDRRPQRSSLHVFQRTPIWVMPKVDATARAAEDRLPLRPGAAELRPARRLGRRRGRDGRRRHLQPPAAGADARAIELAGKAFLRTAGLRTRSCATKLTPRVRLRLQAAERVQRVPPHVQPATTRELVTDPIERITPTGIRTADGTEREIDTLILATGFFTTEPENAPSPPDPRPRRRRPRASSGAASASRPTRASPCRASRTPSRCSARTRSPAPPGCSWSRTRSRTRSA